MEWFPTENMVVSNSCISIPSFRFIPCQFVHFMHFNSCQFTSFQLIKKNSYKQTGSCSQVLFFKLPPRHVPGTTCSALWISTILHNEFKFQNLGREHLKTHFPIKCTSVHTFSSIPFVGKWFPVTSPTHVRSSIQVYNGWVWSVPGMSPKHLGFPSHRICCCSGNRWARLSWFS